MSIADQQTNTEELDEITRQYEQNQLILDRRALIAPLAITPFFPRSSHPMYALLSVKSSLLMLSALVNPFRKKGKRDIWLPVDVLSLLNSYLFTQVDPNANKDAINRFERLANSLFRPGIATSESLIAYHPQGCLFQPGIADVIDAIVCGNFKKPERLLRANPGLLIQRGTAIGPNGVVYENVTPLQAAILSADKELFELIKDLLLSDPNLVVAFEHQRLEIYTRRLQAFCNYTRSEADRLQTLLETGSTHDMQFGRPITSACIARLRKHAENYNQALSSQDFQTIFDMSQTAQQNAAFDLLDSLFEAINNATNAEVTAALSTTGANWQEADDARVKPWADLTLTEKINRFRNTLKTSIPNAESLLQEALSGRGYTHRFDWTNGEDDKQDLCWRQVVGSVQSRLPARIAHVFSCGLWYIVDNNRVCPRTLKLSDDQSVSFYHSLLGFNFAAFSACRPSRKPLRPGALTFRNLCLATQEVFGTNHTACASPQA